MLEYDGDTFLHALGRKRPESSVNSRIASFLGEHAIPYTCPSKGHYKIKVSGEHCKALMFYPNSGKLVIQLNGKNRAVTFQSNNPVVLANKILSLI